MKKKPKKIVKIIDLLLFFLDKKLKWEKVKLTALLNKIKEFNNGIPKGLINSNPKGDQFSPNSSSGTKDLSKKIQNILKKNITSVNKK